MKFVNFRSNFHANKIYGIGMVRILNTQDKAQLIWTAKLYYELNMSQEEIAKRGNISKSTVCRLLKKAVDMNYVKIEVVDPFESIVSLEEELKKTFNIEEVNVCPVYIDDYIIRTRDTCKIAAKNITRLIGDNDTIGVGWGSTMYSVSQHIVPLNPPKRNIKIVQLHGTVVKNIASAKSTGIIENFAECYYGTGYLMLAPVLVDSVNTAEAIKNDSNIRMVFDIVSEANIAVVGVGDMSTNMALLERGIYTEEELVKIGNIDVVGDICSRYFDIYGNSVMKDISDRTIAVTLDELKKKKHVVGVAVGEHKVRAIVGALNTGVFSAFYTDELTAKKVLAVAGGLR